MHLYNVEGRKEREQEFDRQAGGKKKKETRSTNEANEDKWRGAARNIAGHDGRQFVASFDLPVIENTVHSHH